MFAALRLTPLESVRAVILGQDPYHGEGQAHGLAFSVRPDMPLPPTLRDIPAEWEADQELGPAPNGSLVPWAWHDVLLLNAVMTVREGCANSHKRKGWEPFTDAMIRAVSDKEEPVAVLGPASTAQAAAHRGGHVVIQSAHPSPLSATRGPTPFRGSKPFSAANAALQAFGRPPIDWSLADSN